MAPRSFSASPAPVDIKTTQSLSLNVPYLLQNISPSRGTIFVKSASSMPSADEAAFRVEAGAFIRLAADTDLGIWVWSDEDEVPVILDRAA